MRIAIVGVILVGMLGWAFWNTYNEQKTEEMMREMEMVDSGVELEERDVSNMPQVGEQAPPFTLRTLSGEEISLSDFKGEKIFLNFWASWCPPCRAEMPDMQTLYKEDDVIVLAINLFETEPNIEQVERFMEDFELTFPILIDEESNVADKYGVKPIPMSYLIDSEGTIQYISLGPMTYDMMMNEMNQIE